MFNDADPQDFAPQNDYDGDHKDEDGPAEHGYHRTAMQFHDEPRSTQSTDNATRFQLPRFQADGVDPATFVGFANYKPCFLSLDTDAQPDGQARTPRTCGTCGERFGSNNKLWDHLRETEHFIRAADYEAGAVLDQENSWASNT